MRRFLPVIFLFSFYSVSAQDLTGIWRGHFKSDNFSRFLDSTLRIEDKYKFETQINQTQKGFEGVTYSYKTTVFYGKASCVGAISNKTKKVLLTENKLLEVQSADGGACLMTCFLQYSKVGEEEFLEGSYSSISVRDSSQCGGGKVFLRKVTTSDFYKEPFLVEKEKQQQAPPVARVNPPPQKPKTSPGNAAPQTKKNTPPNPKPAAAKNSTTSKPKSSTTPKKEEAVVQNNTPSRKEIKQLPDDTMEREAPVVSAPVPIPRVLANRKNELVRTITSSAKEITIDIYDNGTIDNDTVSVYIDNRLVISRQRLTDKPLSLKLNLEDNKPFHELVMVAENLGEIPPNTSLMVVKAGEEQYEVRITSTEQKNAAVRFRRE